MRSDRAWLLDVVDAIDRLERYLPASRASFDDDERTQVWMVHQLQIIGEACSKPVGGVSLPSSPRAVACDHGHAPPPGPWLFRHRSGHRLGRRHRADTGLEGTDPGRPRERSGRRGRAIGREKRTAAEAADQRLRPPHPPRNAPHSPSEVHIGDFEHLLRSRIKRGRRLKQEGAPTALPRASWVRPRRCRISASRVTAPSGAKGSGSDLGGPRRYPTTIAGRRWRRTNSGRAKSLISSNPAAKPPRWAMKATPPPASTPARDGRVPSSWITAQ